MKIKSFAVVVPMSDDRIFMMRRCGKHHIGMWEFPAGKGEYREDPKKTACREFKEETSADVTSDALIPAMVTYTDSSYNGELVHWNNHYFIVDTKAYRHTLKVVETETHDLCGWFTIAEAIKLYMNGEVVPVHAVILPFLQCHKMGA